MIKGIDRKKIRLRKHARVRKKISGTAECPRFCVFRSNNNIQAQIIDDTKGSTLVSCSSQEAGIKSEQPYGGNKAAAAAVGKLIAERAAEKGITEVVFDRGGYIYHGRIEALASAAREAGLQF